MSTMSTPIPYDGVWHSDDGTSPKVAIQRLQYDLFLEQSSVAAGADALNGPKSKGRRQAALPAGAAAQSVTLKERVRFACRHAPTVLEFRENLPLLRQEGIYHPSSFFVVLFFFVFVFFFFCFVFCFLSLESNLLATCFGSNCRWVAAPNPKPNLRRIFRLFARPQKSKYSRLHFPRESVLPTFRVYEK